MEIEKILLFELYPIPFNPIRFNKKFLRMEIQEIRQRLTPTNAPAALRLESRQA
ncbi:hypothetical protein AT05_11760 [Schleiferia thermophila str. Yellowstone]|jgi:hypothetical protein|nr:hypothetical protein AT05_11760 [Schleiferia thermophila str. Yellowstone]